MTAKAVNFNMMEITQNYLQGRKILSFGLFSREDLEFFFVHNLPVSVVRVNISKTGNYTI